MTSIKELIKSLGTNEELEELIVNCVIKLPERTINIVRAIHSGDSMLNIARNLGVSPLRVSQLAERGYRNLMSTKNTYKDDPLFRGLSIRAYSCLVQAGLNTQEKVILYIKKNGGLSGIENIGIQTLDEILLKLVELGFRDIKST